MTKKNSQKIRFLYQKSLIVMLILGGCQYARDPGYSTRQPKIADLVGIWQPTDDTIADMKTRGNYQISIH